MSADLSTNPSEVAENNSLREVLLFCLVLVVEVYSLAVAFGGPFFQVGYFLLVVISQTTAGAYIWACLRQLDKTLPLPELLAMGFAIGSASAAISQLILRDLLGIRIFLSPLVPIIGVAIWLVAKRNTRLPVTITHANTNTLLWLLFPAPLAISFFQWELFAAFVLPMFIIILIFLRFENISFLKLYLSVIFIALFYGTIFSHLHRMSPALSLVGPDEIYDGGHSIGFSNWGINSNIFQTDSSFSYYKLSYLWLGPIFELTGSSVLLISSAVAIPLIFTGIGLAMWTITFSIAKSTRAACIASVLLFLQHSLTDPWNIPLRPAQSLVLCYLVTSMVALSRIWTTRLKLSLVTAFALFVVFATRAQYGLLLAALIATIHLVSLARKETTIFKSLTFALPSAIFLFTCYKVFFTAEFLDYGNPVYDNVLATLASGLGLRVAIPILLTQNLILNRENLQLKYLFIISALLIFVVDHQLLGDSSFFTILLICSIFIAVNLSSIKNVVTSRLLILIPIFATVAGIVLRLIYDFYKWKDPIIYSGIRQFINTAATHKDQALLFSIPPFALIAIVLMIFLKICRQTKLWRPVLFITAIGMSFGVTLATTFRQVTGHYRYNLEISDRSTNQDDEYASVESQIKTVTNWMKSNSAKDDIFATNREIPDFSISAKPQELPVSIMTHRQSYIEAPHIGLGLRPDYPRDPVSQSKQIKEILKRLQVSYHFPIKPSREFLTELQENNVKWFVVDLGNTELRDWEPYATTRFMNEKVAILELAQLPTPSN